MNLNNKDFVKSCRYLFGGRWHIPLSKKMNCSTEDIYKISIGINPITPKAITSLKECYKDRIQGLQKRLEELESVNEF